MSINVSSDDERSSSDELPGIYISGAKTDASETLRSHSSSTIELDPADYNKENIEECVDLTQGDGALELYESPAVSPLGQTNYRQRSTSLNSNSTIELGDNDAIFDEIYKPSSRTKQSEPAVSPLAAGSQSSSSSGYRTGSSGVSTTESCTSASTGTVNRKTGAKRRKSAASLEDKPKKKATAAAERLSKKQKLQEDRAARKAALELNKVYKPGECMKYIDIEVHERLRAAWYMSDLTREAAAAGVTVTSSPDMSHEGLVMWSRRVPQTLAAGSGQLGLSPAREGCGRALLVLSIEEVSEHVSTRTLHAHVAHVRDCVVCPLTLVVFVKDYFRASGKKKQKGPRITEVELEMALTELLVSTECDAALVYTANELALLLVQFTKAVAEAPHKKAKKMCDEQAEFYMRGDNKRCVTVDKDGHGLRRLWQQMIAVLPQSSLEVSRAVCSTYKSPLELYEAFQDSNGVNELTDIGVDRANIPGARARRVGPEFARKLQTLFTADDGDMLIQ